MDDPVLTCAKAMSMSTRQLCSHASPENGDLYFALYSRGDDVPYLNAWSEAKLKQLQQDRRFPCTTPTS